MAKGNVIDLLKFLKAFDLPIREIAVDLRDFVWDHYPDSNELIYDGPAALAFGWREAYENGLSSAKDLSDEPSSQTLVKSVSMKKRRPKR